MASNSIYSSGKIYKIVDNAYTMCYYGSTTMQLSRRMAKHRMQYRLFSEGKPNRISVFDIFEACGVDNCKIELVEEYPCATKEQLNKREGFYIRDNECVNKNIPGRSKAEYRHDNREQFRQWARDWRAENKEKVKEAHRKCDAPKLCSVCGVTCCRPVGPRHVLSKKHVAAEALLRAQAEAPSSGVVEGA